MWTLFVTFIKVCIYYPFINLLTFLIWLIPGHNAAVGVILITLLVRLVLIAPSRNAAKSQRRMMELQPLLDELKAEYGDDRQGLAMAQMELYKKNNINPFGSCLPLLIQLPVLVALYRAILNGITPNNPHLYSWTLRPDVINNSFFGINILKPDHTFVLLILTAILQFVQTKMMIPKANPNANPKPGEIDPAAMQRQMAYVLPIMTLVIFKNLPAGILIYLTVTTLFSIIQQYYVNQEKLKLTGVSGAINAVESKHPEHKVDAEKLRGSYKELEETTSVQKGVSVTVRKKK